MIPHPTPQPATDSSMTGAATGLVEPKKAVNERVAPPSAEFLARIPRDFARRHLVLSEGREEHEGTAKERLAIAEHSHPAAVHNTGTALGVRIETRVVDPEELARRIDAAYAESPDSDAVEVATFAETAEEIERALALSDQDLLSTAGKGPVVKLVDAMLFEAAGRDASDLHVQPLADQVLIRVRVDGVLQTVRTLPSRLAAPLVSRIKVMGRMDIAEKRIAQDGRATVSIGSGRTIDLRISTLPTTYGERAVIRLLETESTAHPVDFDALGMDERTRDLFLGRASRSSGIVLVTGPTGSGKTTTLYTTLRWLAARSGKLDGGDLNIMTIEDPVEYELSTAGVAISQAQVNTKKGVTFASGLRHILRQDPDVVMVGEIRDKETAQTAIQASLTGHLVFSTLHTNDAASAVTRLVDLGVEPYLVSASLSAVLAQRLVRTRHSECEGDGCERCFGSGYLGRTAVFELLVVDDAIQEAIGRGATAGEVRRLARCAGSVSLRDAGLILAERGVTTRVEAERVLLGLS